MRLFYTDTISEMGQFQSCVIAKEYYEQYIAQHMDGYYLLFGETIEILDDTMNKNGKINKKLQKNLNKFKYKFSIGPDIFGLDDSEQLKLWMKAFKNTVDFTKRDIEKYEEEGNYLCLDHLNLFIHGF